MDINANAAPVTPLPTYGFDGASLTRDDNISLWREAMTPLFLIEPGTRDEAPGFETSVVTRPVDQAVFGDATSEAQKFVRDARTVASTGIDHLLVQLYQRGGYRGETSRGQIAVRSGDISVLDLGQTFTTKAEKFSCLSLMIPRSMIEPMVSDVGALHGTVLRRESPVTRLLSHHLVGLNAILPTASEADTADLLNITVGAVGRSLLRPFPSDVRGGLSLLARARALIDQNVHDPNFGVAALVQLSGMSRASLYRLFEPIGGVANEIRERRLRGAARDLLDPQKGHSIAAIAYRWGFSHPTSFTRAFVDRYQCTPTEARAAGQMPSTSNVTERSNLLHNWLSKHR